MTTPAGFIVTTPGRGPALFLDQSRAVDKAALVGGSVVALYSIHQVTQALLRAGYEEAAECVSDLRLGDLS